MRWPMLWRTSYHGGHRAGSPYPFQSDLSSRQLVRGIAAFLGHHWDTFSAHVLPVSPSSWEIRAWQLLHHAPQKRGNWSYVITGWTVSERSRFWDSSADFGSVILLIPTPSVPKIAIVSAPAAPLSIAIYLRLQHVHSGTSLCQPAQERIHLFPDTP